MISFNPLPSEVYTYDIYRNILITEQYAEEMSMQIVVPVRFRNSPLTFFQIFLYFAYNGYTPGANGSILISFYFRVRVTIRSSSGLDTGNHLYWRFCPSTISQSKLSRKAWQVV